MKPITPIVPGFKLEITEYAKGQKQYISLPTHKQPDGTVTIRWKLNWSERFKLFLTGDLWHQVLTFNQPLQPIKLTTYCPIFGHLMSEEEQ